MATKRASKPKPAAAKPVARPKKRAADPLPRLRAICLGLPETAEQEAWMRPTFRVKGKMFVMFMDNHHGDGRVAIWCKASFEGQDALISSDPERFFMPPYVGPSGWVGLRLDTALDWGLVEEVVRTAYRLAAPKKVLARLDAG